jgi:hypothetical protein
MTPAALLDRRSIMKTAMFGAGALLLPDWVRAADLLTLTGFTHGVASGEPSARSMLLWTRYVPSSRDVADIRAEISQTADFARIVTAGAMQTGPGATIRSRSPSPGWSPIATITTASWRPMAAFLRWGAPAPCPRTACAHGGRQSSPARTYLSAGSTPMPMPQRGTIWTA